MSDKKAEQIEETTVRKTPLALPASTGTDDVTKVDVNSSFKLDGLGPVGKHACHTCQINSALWDTEALTVHVVVVNENGTISRIDNWHEMSDIEKANVNRILLKRNKLRLERLKKEREANGQDSWWTLKNQLSY